MRERASAEQENNNNNYKLNCSCRSRRMGGGAHWPPATARHPGLHHRGSRSGGGACTYWCACVRACLPACTPTHPPTHPHMNIHNHTLSTYRLPRPRVPTRRPASQRGAASALRPPPHRVGMGGPAAACGARQPPSSLPRPLPPSRRPCWTRNKKTVSNFEPYTPS